MTSRQLFQCHRVSFIHLKSLLTPLATPPVARACVSGVARGGWVDVAAVVLLLVGVCEASRGCGGMGARTTLLRAALALDVALPVQAGACQGGMQLATGACCGRDCRGAAAAHRSSSVPSGQTDLTVQSVSAFLAAPTSATSAKRHTRTMRAPAVATRHGRKVWGWHHAEDI